jgi:hypothetical protein
MMAAGPAVTATTRFMGGWLMSCNTGNNKMKSLYMSKIRLVRVTVLVQQW